MTDPLDQGFGFRGVWLFAGITALVLHAALGAFAVTTFQQEEPVELGAPGIEIGIELTSPRTNAADLPPGPDSEASMAAPAVAEQQEEVKEAQLPKDVIIETPEPDRVVSENPAKKPDEHPEVKKTPTKPSEASIAQEATAAPSLEVAQESPKSVTIDPGTGQSKQRVRASWQRELIAHLDRHKRYPAERSGKDADLLVSLIIDRTGKVVSAKVLKTSGDSAFDSAALEMIRRADPVPAPPALVASDGLSFVLPVNFRLKAKS